MVLPRRSKVAPGLYAAHPSTWLPRLSSQRYMNEREGASAGEGERDRERGREREREEGVPKFQVMY